MTAEPVFWPQQQNLNLSSSQMVQVWAQMCPWGRNPAEQAPVSHGPNQKHCTSNRVVFKYKCPINFTAKIACICMSHYKSKNTVHAQFPERSDLFLTVSSIMRSILQCFGRTSCRNLDPCCSWSSLKLLIIAPFKRSNTYTHTTEKKGKIDLINGA